MRRHAELGGRAPVEAQAIFMDFIRSRPFFGATIFPVMQSYTNEIPGECWMAISVRGVHIMARYAKQPLVTHPFEEIVSCNPSRKSILLITENYQGTSKYVFTTDQATSVAALIRDYMEVLRVEE
ncbi:cytochrome c oxidase subunit 1 [Irineochytrium annulatum]|nr:cytochrome c oxidase subunit 1 [Irineochytrium annulatum]